MARTFLAPPARLLDVQHPELEVDLFRPERHQLADAQPMPVGRAKARSLTEDATTMYREMGMTYWLEKAEAETRELV